jgi:hypothetical protein
MITLNNWQFTLVCFGFMFIGWIIGELIQYDFKLTKDKQ